ncbi:putative NUDIX domain containing protein [Leishmania naiffi]|uniref:NUDIX domain containing protein n=1 Tax=Leishmania naiffi TaxID=5678 RepID=A0AAW3C481_9TRYP
MPSGIPSVDLALLTHVTQRLAECRLHAYRPGSHRSAAALVLRFDDDTQRTLTRELSTFRAATARRACAGSDLTETKASGAASSSRGGGLSSSFFSSAATSAASSASLSRDLTRDGRTEPLEFFRYLEHHHHFHHHSVDFVDTDAPSSLQLLFLKRRNMEARWWSGQIVFPGGRRDPDDDDDFDTVCRGTYEKIGFPLHHHREFLCLGRLPDYRLHGRLGSSRSFVQARFVFLHVGDITPTVQLAAHEVESARWVPLRVLTAAHVRRGRVVHPLQSFVNLQDADARLLLGEVFPNTFLSFSSSLLPGIPVLSSSSSSSPPTTADGTEADRNGCRDDRGRSRTREDASSASPQSPPWHVWGLTLRTANELLALGNRQAFDWPLVESNSRLLQYGVLFPIHGYYELLYQLYWWRTWLLAKMRLRRRGASVSGRCEASTSDEQHSSRALNGLRSESLLSKPLSPLSREQQWWRCVRCDSSMERRYAVLPASADALLLAVPETPATVHVVSFAALLSIVVVVLYTVATVIVSACAAAGAALGLEVTLNREARRRAASGAADLGSPENAAAGSSAVSSAVDDAAPYGELGISRSWWPRWLRDDRPPHWGTTAEEAVLSAELRSSTEALHEEPYLRGESAMPPEMMDWARVAAEMAAVPQQLTGEALTGMHPTPSDAGVGAETRTVSPSQATMTPPHPHLTTFSANSTASGTHRERGSVGDEWATGKWRGEVRPATVGVAVPAEIDAAAAAAAVAAEDVSALGYNEELEAILHRYRPEVSANQSHAFLSHVGQALDGHSTTRMLRSGAEVEVAAESRSGTTPSSYHRGAGSTEEGKAG